MKSTGMTRQVDELGRFVLPIEIRRALDIKVKDTLEIFTDEERIVLQKYQPACSFCSNAALKHDSTNADVSASVTKYCISVCLTRAMILSRFSSSSKTA